MSENERLRRWRLVLGAGDNDGTQAELSPDDVKVDQALSALYDSDRKGGLGSPSPSVPKWLGDIRTYFPTSVVQVMQHDALTRLDLKQMLLEPELIESLEPDVNLVSTLISMRHLLEGKVKESARAVVRHVVQQMMRRLESPMRQAVNGALGHSSLTRRPRTSEIDWPLTIRANLKHYQPDYKAIIPQTFIGHKRKRSQMKKLFLLVDQSGSMANSVVYSAIFGAVLLSLPAIKTHFLVFSTTVVDLTPTLSDPVEALFSVTLGGGTDIVKAVSHTEVMITEPQDSILVLISDLIEGNVAGGLLAVAARLVASGVQFIVLLALSDEGAPAYDRELAVQMVAVGVPCFACTPDLFPDLMATAINKGDLSAWAHESGLKAA